MIIELYLICIFLTQSVQNTDFDLSLSGIWGMILKNFNGDYFIGSFFPAFGDLSESSSA
jgi:hypothetical protein